MINLWVLRSGINPVLSGWAYIITNILIKERQIRKGRKKWKQDSQNQKDLEDAIVLT